MKYGELTHFSHPHHTLRLDYSESPFRCDGCREAGIGNRYRCAVCDFDLHRHCALPTTASPPLNHPFFRKCYFYFLPRPPGDGARYCNACGRDVLGFVYHCRSCGFDLHPCCAALPFSLDAGGGLRLYLYRKVSAPCHRCGRRGRGWSYRSSCKEYTLHVACVAEMLVESWQEIYYGGGGKTRAAGVTTRGIGGDIGGGFGVNRIPSIKGAGVNHHKRKKKGKVKKCCEVAAMAIQIIISALLGDPTALIAGVIASFISKG